MDLSQYGISSGNTSSSGNALSAIPGLDGLQGMLGLITVVSAVLGLLFVVLYALNLAQRMRADRAMIAMHKDVAAIKELLEKQIPTATASTPAADSAPGPAPANAPSQPTATTDTV